MPLDEVLLCRKRLQQPLITSGSSGQVEQIGEFLPFKLLPHIEVKTSQSQTNTLLFGQGGLTSSPQLPKPRDVLFDRLALELSHSCQIGHCNVWFCPIELLMELAFRIVPTVNRVGSYTRGRHFLYIYNWRVRRRKLMAGNCLILAYNPYLRDCFQLVWRSKSNGT